MFLERAVDCGVIYGDQRRALMELLRSLGREQLDLGVPATPAWSVRDVLSHLVGITADLNAGYFGAGDPEGWTAAQVSARAAASLEQIGEEWEREAPIFEDGLRLLGYEIGSHYVGDLVQHVSDIRAALHRPRVDDAQVLAVALDFYLDSFHRSLVEARIGSVELSVEHEPFVLGSGPVRAWLTAGRFEVFRCLGGRRSEAQIRALPWRGELDAVVPLVSRYPLPADDLRD